MHSTAVMAVATKRRMIELHETRKMKAAQIAEVFGISEKTFYKWKRRFRLEGVAGTGSPGDRGPETRAEEPALPHPAARIEGEGQRTRHPSNSRPARRRGCRTRS